MSAARVPADHAEELIAAAIGKGWSLTVRRKLAELLNLDEKRVDRIKTNLLRKESRQFNRRSDDEKAAEWRMKVQWAQAAALSSGQLGALTRLLSLEGRHLGIDKVSVEVSGTVEHTAGLISADEMAARRERLRLRLLEEGPVQPALSQPPKTLQ